MQEWEYYVALLEKNELGKEWEEEINGKGKDGWEMVSVSVIENTFYIFFKKPLEKRTETAFMI
ncbi:MAG: hypothetical protein LUM44_09900 [Pyrinomonadaceae bacterium]|nr:hypothetical protein [Pyrinomonadaceae bacterium]